VCVCESACVYVCVYLLEGFWVGVSGVIGHLRHVGLVKFGVKGQGVQGKVCVAIRWVGPV